MKVLSVLFPLFLFQANAHAYPACPGTDRTVGNERSMEAAACTTSGNCTAYDYNPSTDTYETFYGYHASCPGQMQREITYATCASRDGGTYTLTEEGFWGVCQAF